jgi:hypothetical protein
MRTVRLYMTMTCDGCFAGPSGELDWMAATAGPRQPGGDIAVVPPMPGT